MKIAHRFFELLLCAVVGALRHITVRYTTDEGRSPATHLPEPADDGA